MKKYSTVLFVVLIISTITLYCDHFGDDKKSKNMINASSMSTSVKIEDEKKYELITTIPTGTFSDDVKVYRIKVDVDFASYYYLYIVVSTNGNVAITK